MDIDRFFSLGPAAPFQVHEVFTDREAALAAFQLRAAAHAGRSWPTAALMDFQRPADNLLAFIGIGGLGKSTLVHRAARLATDGHLPGIPQHCATAVLNFADPETHSFETVLLRVRAALGPLGRSWPAFDLALALYWERKHPGESLVAFLRRSAGGAASGAASIRVADQVAGVVDQFVGGFGLVGLGYQLLNLAGQKAGRSSRLRRLTRDLPAFEALVNERDPDRMLGYLPVLLAYDLEQHRAKEKTLVLCLLDTFEHVQALPPERGGLEDLVARLVYLMPNVLFLASSRRELAWHDPVRATALTYGGPQRWPGLRSAEQAGVYGPSGDQLHLDGLDDGNADQYLRRRLTREGQPAIPRQLRRRIIDGAIGSPHYLELSAALFERIAARGQTPDEKLFGLPFPELVVRLMRDLDAEDRDLLRAAALLQAFDADTLAAVLPLVRRRRIEDFLRRDLVLTDDTSWPGHRLHENLRQAVTSCDDHTPDGWTPIERRIAALRAADHLAQLALDEHRGTSADSTSITARQPRAVSAFLLGLQAAVEHSILPPQLGQLGYALYELGHWQVLAGLPAPTDTAPPELAALVATAQLSARSDLDAGYRYDRLRSHATGPTDPYAAYTHVTLGNLALFSGELAAAEACFAAAAGQEPPLGSDAQLGLIGVALRTSRFTEPLHLAGRLLTAGVAQSGFADALGHLELHNARFDAAAHHFDQALANARAVRAPLWIARATRHLVLTRMWLDPNAATALLPEARELNNVLGDSIGTAQCDMADALLHAHSGHWYHAEQLLLRAQSALAAAGVSFDLLPIEAVQTLILLGQGRTEQAEATARRLADAARDGRPLGPPAWTAITALWTGRQQEHPFEAVDWIDPANARRRWHAPLTALRARHQQRE